MMLDPVQHLRLRPTVRALLAAASIALLAPLATAQNEQDPVKPVMEVDEAIKCLSREDEQLVVQEQRRSLGEDGPHLGVAAGAL